MLTSVKARIGAMAAVAAIAASGAMAAPGVADAATTHPAARVPTALSIKASAPVAAHHLTFARIVGQLTSNGTPIRFKMIWLERQGPNGHWFIVQRELTRPHGWVAFRVRERKTSSFRLVFHGTANFKPAVSSTVTVMAES